MKKLKIYIFLLLSICFISVFVIIVLFKKNTNFSNDSLVDSGAEDYIDNEMIFQYKMYLKDYGKNFIEHNYQKRNLNNIEKESISEFAEVGKDYIEVSLIDNDSKQYVEIYYGAIQQIESGLVIIRDNKNSIIYFRDFFMANAGKGALYLGQTEEGLDFIAVVEKEERDICGEYRYDIFRIEMNGKKQSIDASVYKWGDGTKYSVEDFDIWQAKLNKYLENSILLISTLDNQFEVIGE